MRYSAAVIGLGLIGQGLDFDLPAAADGSVLTHARAFSLHPGFDLVAGVDIDSRQRARFEGRYRRPAYADAKAALERHRPQVVTLALPVEAQFQLFDAVLDSGPLAIICEKPFAATAEQGRRMVQLAGSRGCLLMVNYIRRFEPSLRSVRAAIQKQEFGTVYKASVWYSKGIMNNGCHFVDILRFLFGEVSDFKVICIGHSAYCRDPEPDAWLRIGKVDAFLLSAREECFRLLEMELLAERGRIRYLNGGRLIEIYGTEPHPVLRGSSRLVAEPRTVVSELSRYQWHAVEALHRSLVDGQRMPSDGTSALRTLEIVAALAAASSPSR